ncbi:MAG: putative circularly permuted ATP-grasp superfamily protein, partial [Psychrobacter glaciei]
MVFMNKKSSQSQSQSQNQSQEDQSQDQSQNQNTNKDTAAPKTSTKDNASEPSQSQSQNQSEDTPVKNLADTPPSRAPSFDELQTAKGQYRPVAKAVGNWLDNINMDALNYLNEQAENIFYRKGVTFTVYSDAKNIERMIPFDIIPRIIAASEWRLIEAGCKQRITALNAFLHDIYHDQAIMKADIVPASYVYASGCYEPWMMGIELDKPIYSHISGIDLIRDESGKFCVLEDNLRTPSG